MSAAKSTRPGAAPVWEGDEIERVLPVIQQLAAGGAAVSIDTRKSGVMQAAIGAGARLVNDVSALGWDPLAAEVVAAAGVPVVLMHHQGDPATMQDAPRYDDVLVEVYLWLEQRIAVAEAAGIARANILVDPGIGFGKSVAHNLELMNGLALFHGLGCGIVLGASRKRMIGALVQRSPGRPAPRRQPRAGAQGGRAGRADRPRPRRSRNRPGAQGVARPSRCGADSAGLNITTIGPSSANESIRPLAGSHSELTDPSK